MNLQEGIIEEFQRHFNKYINSVKRIEYNGKFLDSYKKLKSSPKSCVKLPAQYFTFLHLDIISRSIFPLFRLIHQ